MKKPTIGLSLEGIPFLGMAIASSIVFAIIGCWIMAVILLAAAFFVSHFFRDPERVAPVDPLAACAPADGKVIEVGPAVDPISGETRTRVCIFMNVFNVHVNRIPVSGRVGRVVYYPGKFFNASLDKASEHNERCALELTEPDGKVWTVVQIAGLIARRIVLWAETGDDLARGQRYGLIKFGSRVDCYLPSDYEPLVTVGAVTHAGETPLARKAG